MEGDNLKVIATDLSKLMELKVAFEDKVLQREVQSWPKALDIAKQEILRLNDEDGRARFNIASQSMVQLRCIVTVRPPRDASGQQSTLGNWEGGCTCQYLVRRGELCKHVGGVLLALRAQPRDGSEPSCRQCRLCQAWDLSW